MQVYRDVDLHKKFHTFLEVKLLLQIWAECFFVILTKGGYCVLGTVWCSDTVCWGLCGVLILCVGDRVVF